MPATMADWRPRLLTEMKSWLALDDDDTARLRELVPVIEPHVVWIVDRFYQEIERHPDSNAVLTGPEQVNRLKTTLQRWMREVFEGPHDEAYRERRRAIGDVHVRVGLPNRYIFLAMHLIQRELCGVLWRELPEPAIYIESLNKVLMLDLALMTGTYIHGREAKQLHTLQRLLVDHLRLAVFLLDSDGYVRSATAASARVSGASSSFGRHWTEVLPPALAASSDLASALKRSMSTGRQVTLPRIDVGEGEQRSFRVHLVPLDHPLASMLVQIEELTDAVQMEARLRRSEALAQLGTLSAAVSHELRNPLAGISGALQVICNGLDDEAPHRAILEKVMAEITRLNNLASELLAFARPGEPTIGGVDLRALAEETVAWIRSQTHKAVTVEGEGHAEADPDLIRQILHNLLRNAVDAAQERVSLVVGPGRIEVTDDGEGVPIEKRASIFEPFVTTKTRGTGLGLAVSLRNAKSMKGQLRLVPSPELRGACFRLDLPVIT